MTSLWAFFLLVQCTYIMESRRNVKRCGPKDLFPFLIYTSQTRILSLNVSMDAININLFHGNGNAFDETTKFVNWMVILFKIIALNELCGSHVLLLHIVPIDNQQKTIRWNENAIYDDKDKSVRMPMLKLLLLVVFSSPNSCGEKKI